MNLLLAANPGMPTFDSLYDFIVAGGPVMWPIGFCSLIAMTYSVDRMLRLRRARLIGGRFEREVVEAARDGGEARALEVCERSRSLAARIFVSGLKKSDKGSADVEKAVEDAGAREARRLFSSLRPLAAAGTVAPMLGLLGTVWGIVDAFSAIALKHGLGKPEMLASGIGQALVNTVAGLCIAIPTQVVYFYFKSRIDGFISATEELWNRVVDVLDHRQKEVARANPS